MSTCRHDHPIRWWFRSLKLGVFLTLGLADFSLVQANEPPADGVEVLSGYRLKYSVETTAKQSTIWRLWSDVENWKRFDTLLEYSRLDEGHYFEPGATGVIKADGANKTGFKLTQVTPGVSFTETLFVPLYQRIELKRYFEKSESGQTIFTHEVVFKGRLRFLIYAAAASQFKKELPLVMGRLKAVAESDEKLSDLPALDK